MYQEMFEVFSRLAGKKEISVLKSDKIDSFIGAVLNDGQLELSYKVFLVVSASGGLRVTEALSLKKESFFKDGEKLFVKVAVLKKRKKPETRLVQIHPAAMKVVADYISNCVGAPFKFSERTALRKIKTLTGLNSVCNHSMRHSFISFLLFEKNMQPLKAAKLVHIGLKSMEHYLHLNEKKVWSEVFEAE